MWMTLSEKLAFTLVCPLFGRDLHSLIAYLLDEGTNKCEH